MHVVALGEPLDVLGVVEELDREAERVLDSHGLADAAAAARRDALGTHAEGAVVVLGTVELPRGTDAVGEPGARRHLALAQHQGVVEVLLEGAQVDGVVVLGGDDQAEHVDVEPRGLRQVGDDQLGVGATDDVGRCGHRQFLSAGAEARRVHLAEGDVHDLLLGVEVDGPVAALVAEPRGLDPAERGAQVADVVRVEPDHAGLDRLRDPVAAGQVGGPDVGGQPVLDVRWPARTASASSSNGVSATTGPKISSWKIRAVGGTSAKTVGAR